MSDPKPSEKPTEKPIERNPEYAKAFDRMEQRNTIKRGFRRAGCFAMIGVWLILMLLPCFFVTLLVRKDITISRSDIPEHEYRIFILENRDERGFGFSRGNIESGGEDEGKVCIVTQIDYLLWEGKGEDSEYCDCYEKIGDEWSVTMVGGDANCQPVEFELDE